MAREIEMWGNKCDVPRDYVAVEPGNATVTRYIKTNSDVVYTQKRANRKGYTRIVRYYAPPAIVREALLNAQECERRSTIRAEARERSRLLEGGAEEAVAIFLALAPDDRVRICAAYADTFGDKKAEYLRRSYARWQAGDVAISREMRERLLRFVPPLLSFEGKYLVIKALWNSTRSQDSISVYLAGSAQIPATVDLVVKRLVEIRATGIPRPVSETVAWLAGADSQLALLLVQKFGHEEDGLVAETLRSKLAMLHEFVCRSGKAGHATHVVSVPGLQITVRF